MKKIVNEPAFVLHRYDWSESSLILEVFTRHHGRVALAAKGVKRPTSNFRPVLLPLQPLQIAFGGDGEIRTLKAAQWMGPHTMPVGEALMAGYHLNELLLKLLARDDPHPRVFDAYAPTVLAVATSAPGQSQAVLRAFELLLLRELGLLPVLDVQSGTLTPLDDDVLYALQGEGGLREVVSTGLPPGQSAGQAAISGWQWRQMQLALGEAPGAVQLAALADVCEAQAKALRPMLRALLHYHCGVPRLRTRQVMVDLQDIAPTGLAQPLPVA
jgi:DNA repair protein RecO (recombination protein O)